MGREFVDHHCVEKKKNDAFLTYFSFFRNQTKNKHRMNHILVGTAVLCCWLMYVFLFLVNETKWTREKEKRKEPFIDFSCSFSRFSQPRPRLFFFPSLSKKKKQVGHPLHRADAPARQASTAGITVFAFLWKIERMCHL